MNRKQQAVQDHQFIRVQGPLGTIPPPLLLDPSAALSYRSLNPLGSAPAIEDLSNGSMSKYDPGKWQMQNAQNLQDSGKSAIQKTGRNQFKMLRRMYGERSEEEDLIQ